MPVLLSPFTILFLLLLSLFVVSLYSRRAGFGIRGMFLWGATIIALLAGMCWKMKEGCLKLFHLSLSMPASLVPQATQQPESSYFPGYDLVFRIIILIPSLGVILGDYLNNTDRNVPYLHTNTVHIPFLNLDAAAGLLWFAAPCLVGLLLWDILGFSAGGSRLLPQVSREKLSGLGMVTAVLFLLTVADVSFFYLYGQVILDKIVKAHPTYHVFGMPFDLFPLLISQIFGVIMAVDSVLAILGLALGICGLVSVVFGLLFCTCFLAYEICCLLGVGLATFGGVYTEVPWHPFTTPKPIPLRTTHSESEVVVVSSPAPLLFQPKEEVPTRLLSAPTQESEMTMAHATVSIVYVDRRGTRFAPYMQEMIGLYETGGSILCQAHIDIRQPNADLLTFGKKLPPVWDRSKDSEPETYMELLNCFTEQIIHEYASVKKPGMLLYVVDKKIGVAGLTPLEELRRRLHFLTHITVVTNASLDDLTQQRFINLLETLWEKKTIATTLLDSPHAGFLKHGEDKLLENTAQFFASLIASGNLNEVLEAAGREAAFCAVGFASVKFEEGTTPTRGKWMRLFTKNTFSGNSSDLLKQAKFLAGEVVKPASLAYHSLRSVDPTYFVVHTSHEKGDPRVAPFAKDIDREIRSVHPSTHTITVPGKGGVGYTDKEASICRVGMSIIYPLFRSNVPGAPNAPVQEKQAAAEVSLPEQNAASPGAFTSPVTVLPTFPVRTHQKAVEYDQELDEEEELFPPSSSASPTSKTTEQSSELVNVASLTPIEIDPETVETPPPAQVEKSNGHGKSRRGRQPKAQKK
jgi:hypothetical protein